MAISFVGAGAVDVSSNPDARVPAGIQKNDLLLIVTTGTTTPTTPAGWTQLAAQGSGQFLTVLFKFAAASESNVTLTQSGTTSKAVMVAYRGAGGVEVLPSFTAGTSTTPTPNTVTTTYSNDYVISLYACATTATTFTPNASTTSRVNSASDASRRGLLIADELQAAAGVSTARAATLSASRAWSSFAIGLIEDNRTLYWVGGNGTWSGTSTTNWSNTSGGTGGVVAPSLVDDAIINASSGSPTVTLSGSAACKSLTTTGATCTLTSTGTLELNGNMTLSANTTWSATGRITFFGGATITTNGVSLASPITVNTLNEEVSLGSNLTTTTGTTPGFTLTRGTLNLSTFTLNTNSFNSEGAITRSINFGSGSAINITGNAATVWSAGTATGFSTSGTPTVNFTYSGSSGTRTVVHGTTGGTGTTGRLNFNITAGTDAFTFTSNSWIEDLNTIGFSGILTPNSLSLVGSLTYGSGTTVSFGTLTFRSTSPGRTITTAGKPVGGLIFSGFGGAWTLQDNLTSSGAITLTSGSLTTNDKTVTCATFSSNNSNVRELNLGSSTINLSSTGTYWNFATTTNLTFNAGTSQINSTVATSTNIFAGGGLTYHNYNFNSDVANTTITGNNTFNTFSCTTPTSGPADILFTGTTQTVTNFNVDGGSYINFMNLNGGTLLKSSGTVSLSFASISTAATGGATWNAFGCRQASSAATGWNFGVQTRYLIGSGAINNYSTPERWSTTSGGLPNAMTPFQFDDVIFDTNSGSVAFTTSTSNETSIKSLNTLTFTGSYAGGTSSTLNVYGSIIIGANTSLTRIAAETFLNGTSSGNVLDIRSSNKFLGNNVFLNCFSGDYTLLTDNMVFSAIIFNSGTFNFGNNTVSGSILMYEGTENTTINLNAATINLSSNGTQYCSLSGANLTLNPGTSTVNLTSFTTSGLNFVASSKTFNIVNLKGIIAGQRVDFFIANGTINKLTTDNIVGGYSLEFMSDQISTIGEFDIRGTPGNLVIVESSSSGNATLASLGGVKQSNIDYISFINITGSPTPTSTGTVPYYWYVGENSIVNANSIGFVFSSDASYTYYNLTSGTSWSVPANWNSSNNNVYMIGGGGGGSGSVVASAAGSHNSGSGGGGGGFTALTNVTLTAGGTVSYTIGAGATPTSGSTTSSIAGNGGTTTFNVSNTAGGGGGGATALGTATAGAAGTGVTFNGGAGGLGSAPNTNTSNAGGGGGGSGGLNAVGANGGANSGTTGGVGGQGNNNLGNYLFVSGVLYGDGGNGGLIGSAGTVGTGFGGGGGGGGTTASSGTVRSGQAGTQGAIVIRYQIPTSTSNFFLLF
jgi:hypothetical protein